MSKRAAEVQLTQDNLEEEYDASEVVRKRHGLGRVDGRYLEYCLYDSVQNSYNSL